MNEDLFYDIYSHYKVIVMTLYHLDHQIKVVITKSMQLAGYSVLSLCLHCRKR